MSEATVLWRGPFQHSSFQQLEGSIRTCVTQDHPPDGSRNDFGEKGRQTGNIPKQETQSSRDEPRPRPVFQTRYVNSQLALYAAARLQLRLACHEPGQLSEIYRITGARTDTVYELPKEVRLKSPKHITLP